MINLLDDMFNPFETVTDNTKTFIFYIGFPWKYPMKVTIECDGVYVWNRQHFYALMTKVYQYTDQFPVHKAHARCMSIRESLFLTYSHIM